MQFDLFHSLGRIDTILPQVTDRQVFLDFFAQAKAAEDLGFGTAWVAESHFSSEVQKLHAEPVIPEFRGEIGLNNDSPQLAHALFERTSRIGFGTAIYNVVGGNGGPLGAADRVRSLAFINSLREAPRSLHLGIAAGRFPYINKPYGVLPRDPVEAALWPQYKRLIFLEALEIFLRLSNSETVASTELTRRTITRELFSSDEAWERALRAVRGQVELACGGVPYRGRWTFEPLRLVPALPPADLSRHVRFVLGSSDPLALDLAFQLADIDVFNLSFTPPEQIDATHELMRARCSDVGRAWHRGRMPRTVLVFVDKDRRRAEERASRALDLYLAGMDGTVAVPEKQRLLSRALVGDGPMVREQLSPDDPRGFHPDDRLMLWFEYGQADSGAIIQQMHYFADQVMAHDPSKST
jgi:alkanesulfonate monooxygenase SsuD/methylene tetrahydromethanopterin reductase-like flavin-dependent oxidoreductase (luciferase family)